MILDMKYVLHIPTHKFENGRVTVIKMNKYLKDLESKLNESGFHSFYKTKVEGHYKSRSFDEILITIFTSRKQNLNQISYLYNGLKKIIMN